MSNASLPPPTYADVVSAAQRLAGVAHRTHVLRSNMADALLGTQAFFKCENQQRTGSFKFRGAYNTLSQFSDEQRERGVLAFSAGNHAQAIALSARLLDMPALIVMPEDAPTAKMAATREYGAQVVTYDRYTEDREAISQRLAEERGMTLVPPFDHPHVIAGQGTAAREFLEEMPDLDYLFVCVGGGGMLAGSLLAAEALAPNCRVVGVEPEAGNDGQQSFRTGQLVQIPTPHHCRWRADTVARADHLSHHPAPGGRHRHRHRRATGRGHALLRRAHEAGGRAHGRPGLCGRTARQRGRAWRKGRHPY